MQHHPLPASERIAPYANSLASRALGAGKLVVYVGAGVSMSQPTALPSGAALAVTIHSMLKTSFPVLDAVDGSDLNAVADAVAALPGGEEALRLTAARAASFKSATPGYAHRVLAHLVLEGAIDVLTTNWDNCIERGADDEQLLAAVTARDLTDVSPPWLLKLHGCATRPASLLLTSSHLDSPPSWVREQTEALMGSAVVVFIGIGDIAGYVRRRVEEAIAELESLDNIRIVAPNLEARWNDSRWSEIAPALEHDKRISVSADVFMEELAAAYVRGRLQHHALSLGTEADHSAPFARALQALFRSDSLQLLQWSRKTDINPRAGESVLKSRELATALVALGQLVGDSSKLIRGRQFDSEEGPIEILLSTEAVPARRLADHAQYRLQSYANNGETCPRFVVAGGVGRIPQSTSLPRDIVSEQSEESILDGPLALVPEIIQAEELLAS